MKPIKAKSILIITSALCFFIFAAGGVSLEAQEASSETGTAASYQSLGFTTSISDGTITDREQREFDRSYKFRARQKQIVLSPYRAAPGEKESDAVETEELTEEEKMYRYFGIASDLRESGKIEEAIELLEYILHKRPDDAYVKNYLKELRHEANKGKGQWQVRVRKEAEDIRREKINDFTSEAKIYYRRQDYDKALLRIADILTLDPKNKFAHKYMAKMKGYYLREANVEDIALRWEIDKTEAQGQRTQAKTLSSSGEYGTKGVAAGEKKLVVELLDKTEYRQKGITSKKERTLKDLLAESEYRAKGFSPKTKQAVEELLDEEEMNLLIINKKAGALLEETELGFRVEEIIAKQRDEERKSRQFSIGKGDVVQISIRDHPELSGTVSVGLKGELILPLTNDIVEADGLTLDQLQKELTEKMKRYVKKPVINVTIVDYRSKVFYVLDEGGATPYTISRANFTLRDALFASDWGTGRALGRVLIMRPAKHHPIVKKVDAFDIVYRGKLKNNIKIKNGDVIYIPKTAASKIIQTISDTAAPLNAFRSTFYSTFRELEKPGKWMHVGQDGH